MSVALPSVRLVANTPSIVAGLPARRSFVNARQPNRTGGLLRRDQRPGPAGIGRARCHGAAGLPPAVRAVGAPAVADAGARLRPRPRAMARLPGGGTPPAHVRPVLVLPRRAEG